MNDFEQFGTPDFGAHAFERCITRGLSLSSVDAALRSDPRPGTKPGTLWYRGPAIVVVVKAATGHVITMWAT